MTAAGALIATAALALRVPPASTRRQAVISGAALATTGALSRPASAFEFGFDLTRSGEAIGPVKKAPPGEKQNSGIKLLRETFDGGLPEDGLLKWYDEHLASDFEAVFAGGKVVLDKKVGRRHLAELRPSRRHPAHSRASAPPPARNPPHPSRAARRRHTSA